MAVINNGTVNPTSTYKTYGPDTRGPAGMENSYIFKDVGPSVPFSLPEIESFPALFAVVGSGATLQPIGLVAVTNASTFVLIGATANLNTTAGANVLDPTISNGVLTFTPHPTFTTRDIVITRIG